MSSTMGTMERILRLMSEKKASDIYLSAFSPALIRINGQMLQLSDQLLTPSQPRQLISEVIEPAQLAELDAQTRAKTSLNDLLRD